ncbi:hypothetical protein Tco_1472343, partial [Tanacetum coccineum]
MWDPRLRWGLSLGIIAGDCIPDEYSPATCRWGYVSPAT